MWPPSTTFAFGACFSVPIRPGKKGSIFLFFSPFSQTSNFYEGESDTFDRKFLCIEPVQPVIEDINWISCVKFPLVHKSPWGGAHSELMLLSQLKKVNILHNSLDTWTKKREIIYAPAMAAEAHYTLFCWTALPKAKFALSKILQNFAFSIYLMLVMKPSQVYQKVGDI